ncbi:MAG: ExbD/TolR family protein [Halochromatium sp.]
MRFHHPRPRSEQESSLIPLINIVFLLLIFFMVVGTITAPDAFPVDPPVSQQSRAEEADALQLLIDAEGRIALDGEVLAADQIEERLRERLAEQRGAQPDAPPPFGARSASAGDAEAVSAADANAIDAANARAPIPHISLKADSAVAMSQLRPLLAQLRALGVERVRLLTRQG